VDVVGVARGADRIQRRWPWLGFPFAVVRKFADDQAGNLAALLSYYAFVSVFPLLLVLVTVLDLVLRNDPELQQRIVHSALVEFPVIGDQLRLGRLHGSWSVFAISLAISLWGSQGVANAAQNAFNTLWNVPFAQRPGILSTTLRSVGLLIAFGLAVLVTGTLSGAGSSGAFPLGVRAGAFVLSAVINIGIFILGFRLATARDVATRDLVPGAVLAALIWQALLAFGSILIAHHVRHVQSLYGVFGVVLGLLGWLHLQAVITLYAVELDVVRARRLWPRSGLQPPLTKGDRRAYTAYAQTERRRPADEEEVDVRFAPEAGEHREEPTAPD